MKSISYCLILLYISCSCVKQTYINRTFDNSNFYPTDAVSSVYYFSKRDCNEFLLLIKSCNIDSVHLEKIEILKKIINYYQDSLKLSSQDQSTTLNGDVEIVIKPMYSAIQYLNNDVFDKWDGKLDLDIFLRVRLTFSLKISDMVLHGPNSEVQRGFIRGLILCNSMQTFKIENFRNEFCVNSSLSDNSIVIIRKNKDMRAKTRTHVRRDWSSRQG